MKPSEKCKKAGLKSLVELAEISGESVQTLNNWYKKKMFRFDAVLEAALDFKGIPPTTNIKAAMVVSEFHRRGLAIDRIEKVSQGLLLMWLFCNEYVCELRFGADTIESKPGEWKVSGGGYINTYTPQEIANDIERKAGPLPGFEV